MIISKDLFIFGEQIFATIIPEGGSSQTSQQQQQQQQQQQAQHQLAIINTTTLTTAAAAAAISATQITTALTTSTATAAGTAPPPATAAAATTGPGTGTATTTAATATVGAAETAVVEAKLQKIPKEVEEHKQQHQYKQQQQQQQPAQHLAKTRKKESQQKGLSDENGGIKISAKNTRTEQQQQQQQQQLPQQKQQESLTSRVAAAATTAVGVEVSAVEANARTKDSEKEPLVKRNLAKIKPATTTATITAAKATPATAAVGVEAAGIGTGAVAGAAVAIVNPKTTTTTITATPETATTATSNFAIHEATPLLLGERAEALELRQPLPVADCHLQLQLDAEVPSASTTTTIAATSDRSSIAADQPEHSLRSLNSNEDLPPLNMAKVMLGNNTRSDHAMATFPFISAAEPHQQHTLQLTFQSINVLHNDRKILSDVSGLVSPGEVLAIMGPSGSGKTTLLDCLSGQRRIDSGAVYLNREPLSKKWRRKICYVLQEEVFFSGLTLRETVMYTALLRLPEKMPKAEKIKLVDNILEALELKFCQQTKFGDYLNRGLSGGEKKRANIACELLTNPLLMLLDEPTSGLDSHSAISLMKFLKRYAMEEQKTVVITVHQPSSQMFHMFDKLLLLYNGRTAYFGEVNNIYSYFENIGVAIKPHYNPADFVLEQLKSYPDIREKLFIAAKESHGNFLNRNCITVNTNNHNDYHNHHHEHHNHNHNHSNSHHAHQRHNGQNGSANGVDVYTTTTAEVVNEKAHKHDSLINDIINNYYKDMHNNHNHSHNHHINHDAMLIIGDHQSSAEEASQQLWYGVDSQSNSSASTGDCQRYESCDRDRDRDRDRDSDWLDYPTRFHTQFSVLSSRNFKEAKPRMLSKLNWFQTVGLALMAGSIWFQIPRTEEFLHDLQGWMFFSQTYWMLFALFGALNSFPSEREVISKERRSGAYRLSAYYLAKMFGELPLVVTLPTVYLMISYPMLGCSSFKLFFLMLVFLLLNTIVAQSVGFFIGACCMDMNVSITLSALYTLATQLFGGYLSSRIPDGLSWLRYTSMIHYAYQNMQILEFREGPAIRCGSPSSYEICKANSTTHTTFIPYEEILKAQNSTSPLWLNTLVLTMFFLVFRGLGYAVLRYVRCPKT